MKTLKEMTREEILDIVEKKLTEMWEDGDEFNKKVIIYTYDDDHSLLAEVSAKVKTENYPRTRWTPAESYFKVIVLVKNVSEEFTDDVVELNEEFEFEDIWQER